MQWMPAYLTNPTHHGRRGVAGALCLGALLASGRAQGQRVNFAKFQHVAASSQNSTYSADLAVDGIVSNFHSWRSTGTGVV
jgi:hypothetical protein